MKKPLLCMIVLCHGDDSMIAQVIKDLKKQMLSLMIVNAIDEKSRIILEDKNFSDSTWNLIKDACSRGKIFNGRRINISQGRASEKTEDTGRLENENIIYLGSETAFIKEAMENADIFVTANARFLQKKNTEKFFHSIICEYGNSQDAPKDEEYMFSLAWKNNSQKKALP